MSFTIRWRATCADCLEDILPGQQAKSTERGGYTHAICPDPGEVVKTDNDPEGVCPNCNSELTANDACGDCGWLGY